jgi:hypothetical protein
LQLARFLGQDVSDHFREAAIGTVRGVGMDVEWRGFRFFDVRNLAADCNLMPPEGKMNYRAFLGKERSTPSALFIIRRKPSADGLVTLGCSSLTQSSTPQAGGGNPGHRPLGGSVQTHNFEISLCVWGPSSEEITRCSTGRVKC